MPRLTDISGNRYGRLLVLNEYEIRKHNHAYWLCRCDCGKTKYVSGSNLMRGLTKSCGCMRSEVSHIVNSTHGLSNHRLFHTWVNMRDRCNNSHRADFVRYGKRGICVCEEWKDFKAFYDWAIANGYEDGLTIDRIDNNGNYEPSNCRWVSPKVQANNTRRNRKLSYQERTGTISEWADYLGITYSCMLSRVRRGWSMERIVSNTRKEK